MTPDREAIEEHLEDADVERIRQLAKRIGLSLDRWPEHSLFAGWVFLAVETAADRLLQERRARSRTQARRMACGELGVSFDAIDRKERRARRKIADISSATGAPPPVSIAGMDIRPEGDR